MIFEPQIATSYLDDVYHLGRFRETVREAEVSIRAFAKKTSFDAIAFTGTSGAALAYPLSLRLSTRLICVRKGRSHSWRTIEGCVNASKFIIVDDCIETGDTVRRINRLVKEKSSSKVNPRLVGIYLYSEGTDRAYFTLGRRRVPIIRHSVMY